MSDTNQWPVTISGEAPPPEIPWALIVGGAIAVGVGAVGVYAWRKKK